MLAECAPRAWLASQTSHWAAAVVASSSLNAAVQARSRMAPSRKVASSSMTRRSPSTCALPERVARRSVGRGRDGGHLARSPVGRGRAHGTAASRGRRSRPGSATRLDHHQEDDDDDQRREEDPATLDLLDRREELRRRRSGRGARRWRRRRHLDQVMQGVALDRQRVGDGDQVQDDAGGQPEFLLGLDLQGDQQQDAGDPLEDGQRVDQLVADGLHLARAEVGVLRFLARHRPHDRVGECRARTPGSPP